MKNILLYFLVAGVVVGQDMPLSQVLIDGEEWELVSEGNGFTDACASDAEGNFYYCDMKEGPGIYKVDPDGNRTVYIDGLEAISGMQIGPDGRIYACQGKLSRVIAVSPDGEVEVLLEDVRPNDLVVTHDGGVYFTHTKPQKIEYISPDGVHRTVHEGNIVRPNGITLSPDQGTLIVSDHGGKNVWAFRIEEDGSLAHPQPYMTVRTPNAETEVSKGDGSTTDAYGRYYVTTEVGIHMFDPTGRLGGVIANPQPRVNSIEFSGPGLNYIYVAAADKIFRRKTKAKGILFQDAPVKTLPFKG
tara:strand:+ start:982 stop:1884 length:903 start_codon:yes stop_codon:yes gene_type:complete